MGEMKTHVLCPFWHVFQVTFLKKKLSYPEKDVCLVNPSPDLERTLKGLLKGRLYSKTFPHSPYYLRYSYVTRTSIGASITVCAVPEQLMVRADLLSHEEGNKDVLRIYVEGQIVSCAYRRADLA